MSHKLLVNPKYENFEPFLIDIRTIFSQCEGNIHKARNELKIITIAGIECVVKSFKIPHFINRTAYTFVRDGKARKSFLNAMKLQELGINTPEPIGMIEFYDMGLLRESFYLSRYEPYDFTIREVFHHKVEETDAILEAFAAFSYDLHQKGVWHVDYSLGNILISKQEEGYRFSLVDINRMRFGPVSPMEGLKNFNKFWAKERNDLVIIAKRYARLAKLDEATAVKTVLASAQRLEDRVNLKRKLKG